MVTKEVLKITWKIIRRKGYGRTPTTYCTYIAENKKHTHRMRVYEGSELFKLLSTTVISKHSKYHSSVYVTGTYVDGKLVSINNPQKVGDEGKSTEVTKR